MTPGNIAIVTEDDDGIGPVRLSYNRRPITPLGFIVPETSVLVLSVVQACNVVVLEGRNVVRLVGDAQLSRL